MRANITLPPSFRRNYQGSAMQLHIGTNLVFGLQRSRFSHQQIRKVGIEFLHRQKCLYHSSSGPQQNLTSLKLRSSLRTAGVIGGLFLTLFAVQRVFAEDKGSSTEKTHEQLTCVFRELFSDLTQDELIFAALEGGRSQTRTYRVDIRGCSYVIRLNDPTATAKNQSELFTLKNAAERGIAPYVHYSSPDASVIVMDFIEGGTSTSKQARKLENISRLALIFRQVHTLPINPNSPTPVFEKIYQLYCLMKERGLEIPELDAVVEQLFSLKEELEKHKISPTTNHGDLNPCNIFFADDKVVLIDWYDNVCEDPFYDLSCFALCHNFDERDEELLLTTYLGNYPNPNEKARYALIKRMDYGFFAIELFSIAYEFAKTQGIVLKKDTPSREWSYYMTQFEDKSNILSSQFFYDFAQCALTCFHIFQGK